MITGPDGTPTPAFSIMGLVRDAPLEAAAPPGAQNIVTTRDEMAA